MRTHVEFRSDAFPAEPDESQSINPGRWGKRLADYLSDELITKGFGVNKSYAEDWGWAIPIANEDFPLWIGCGNYEEWPDGFLCFIEPSKPFVRKWLRKIATTERVAALADAIDFILRQHPQIREIRWWPPKETQ